MDDTIYAVWLRVNDQGDYTFPDTFKCSNCRNAFKGKDIDKYPYIGICPICKAKMRDWI